MSATTDDAATIHALIIGTSPALLLIPERIGTLIADDGALVSGDILTDALLALGARPLSAPEPAYAPAPGWRTDLDRDGQALTITAPGETIVYDGDAEFDDAWYELLDPAGVMLYVIAASSPSAALDALGAGRGIYVVLPLG